HLSPQEITEGCRNDAVVGEDCNELRRPMHRSDGLNPVPSTGESLSAVTVCACGEGSGSAGPGSGGHGRLLACRELGWSEVPTLCLDHLTPAQARAFSAAARR